MGRLGGKVAVITGAASGIGAATALQFAREGAALVLADLNTEGGEHVAAECRAAGARAVFQRCDVAEEEDVAELIARAGREHGGLHVLFNNAGLGGALGPIEQTAVADWDSSLAVLLRSVFLGMKHGIPLMRKSGGGSIISTASVAGLRGGAGPHAYSAAKAAVVNLTRSVALEVAKDSIRVNCICPGGINTPLISGRLGGEELTGQILRAIQPLPRAGRPDDIAAMALFLASDDSVFVTGAAMVVDGGLTAGGSLLQGDRPIEVEAGFSGPSFEYPRS